MIASLVIYGTATSLLISVGGLALERVAVWRGAQRRTIWAFALVLAILLPAGRTISPHLAPMAAPPAQTRFTSTPTSKTGGAVSANLTSPVLRRFASFDTALGLAWAVSSLSLVSFYLLVAARLWRDAGHWQPSRIDGRQVWVTDALGPAVYGLLRPRILLPQWIVDGPAQSRSLVLAHEQEHVTGRDNWLLLLGLMVVAAAPWNVPLWWQFRRLRFAIEVDCDARVLARGAEPRTYGQALLRVAEQQSRIPVGAIGLTEPASQLLRRVRIITAALPRRSLWMVCVAFSASLTCVAMAAGLEPPAFRGAMASNGAQVPIAGKALEGEHLGGAFGCDPSTGKAIQGVIVMSGGDVLGRWSGSSTAIHKFVLPNGFELGLEVEPASANQYVRLAKATGAKYVPELVRIALFDMKGAVPRQITYTFGPVNSIQGYGPEGGADRVVEVGEPGITLMLHKQACVAATG